MPPQQPSSSTSAVQVVTLTVYSSGTSTQSGVPPPSSSGGGSSVPVGAIAGGVAGGMVFAVTVVLLWKYWGLVIKRTEKLRRKEEQDMLTVRENTRRNASSGFKPQSQYRPTSTVNTGDRKVTFLARTPTLLRAKQDNANPAPSAITSTTEEKGDDEQAPTAVPESDETPHPSSTSASVPAPLIVHEEPPPEIERKPDNDESGEPPLPAAEEEAKAKSTPASRRSRSPTPSGSTSRRSPSPTPSRTSSKRRSFLAPSRSTRMRTPARLPDPPSVPPILLSKMSKRSSSPAPPRRQTSPAPSRSRSATSSRANETVASRRNTLPVPMVPPAAGSSSSSSSSSGSGVPILTRSPLRNSVLPTSADRPVIMPRPKNAAPPSSAAGSQPAAPSSTSGNVAPLPSSHLQPSAGNGESSGRHWLLYTPPQSRPTTGASATSAQSGASEYATANE